MNRILFIAVLIMTISFRSSLLAQKEVRNERNGLSGREPHRSTYSQSAFTGEVIWYNLFCTSPLFPGIELSRMAYIELVNSDNASLIRKKVLLTHGVGKGEFMIPEDIATGVYYIIAYTNWMKNFGESNFFKTTLTIINPSEKLVLPDSDTIMAENDTEEDITENSGAGLKANSRERHLFHP